MSRRRGEVTALAAAAVLVFALHIGYLRLPYFWDELGQFVPAALDILREGAWIPRSTVPNSHPPGVMAYLALVWRIFGYSIPATRAAMLAVGAALVPATYALARRLGAGAGGAALAALLLAADPLFETQAMLAQLDLPAALCATAALALYLNGRIELTVVACTALVLVKDTGAVLPIVFAADLLRGGRRREAFLFTVPLAALAVWFAALWHTTGRLFGDSGYTHYNLTYPLHPMRAAVSVLRRLYYLFAADFRWIGACALGLALRRTPIFRTRGWRIAFAASLTQALVVTFLGGAALERYLLPVLPVLYCAYAAALTTLSIRWRVAGGAALAAGLVSGWFLNPPFPFPYENNFALVDFVRLHQAAAAYLEAHLAQETVYTAWPLTAALRRPEFGYVRRGLATYETSDVRASTLIGLETKMPRVVVVYSRTWAPGWSVLRFGWVARFLARYYDYGPDMSADEAWRYLHLRAAARWERRGQWIAIYTPPDLVEPASR